MKKALLSLACVGFLAHGANAYEYAGVDLYFDSGYHYNIHYKDYTNKNDLIFSGSLEYHSAQANNGLITISGSDVEFEGMVGKTLTHKKEGKIDMKANALGGGMLRLMQRKAEAITGGSVKANGNSIGFKALLNISGTYDKNILFSADLSYSTYFGDYDKHIIRYEFGAGYKFNENFYTKANIRFDAVGENEKHSSQTLLGMSVGCKF